MTAYGADLRYDVPGEPGRVGHAVASFQAGRAGDYCVRADTAADTGGTLAIGDDITGDVIPHQAGAAAVFLIGGGIGLVVIITTAVRRYAPGR